MTDLHCHILPAIDDGAKNAKVSMELLRMQNDAGITDIVCTPHFNPDSQNLEDFIDKRYRSARYLADYVFRSETRTQRRKIVNVAFCKHFGGRKTEIAVSEIVTEGCTKPFYNSLYSRDIIVLRDYK